MQQISDILQNPAQAQAAQVLEILSKHPTCVLPAAAFLGAGAPGATADELLALRHAAALGCADRLAMADLADLSGQDWASIYPPMAQPKQKSTNDAIDIFIETYGHASPQEDALLEKLIFNPVAPDYLAGADEPYNPDDPLALPPELQPKKDKINLQKKDEKPQAQPLPQAPEEPEPALQTKMADSMTENVENGHEETSLMESLAKIFIKQRRYERALEIINNLSLKYPEKSVYFADQIRFLQKLVANQRRWQASEQANSQK